MEPNVVTGPLRPALGAHVYDDLSVCMGTRVVLCVDSRRRGCVVVSVEARLEALECSSDRGPPAGPHDGVNPSPAG